MDICGCMYVNRVNDDVFETFLKSFRSVSDALLQVYIGEPDYDEVLKKICAEYNVMPITLAPEAYQGQRCYSKMLCAHNFLVGLPPNSRTIFCDVDLYFLADPFTAFDRLGPTDDLGITTRICSYKHMVNSGFWISKNTSAMQDVLGQQFGKYAIENQQYKDWFIDQLYLNHLWLRKEKYLVDIGYQYNFCPNTDVFGVELAQDMIRRAYECRAVKVLHLKSELKMLVYEGFLKYAVTKRPNGIWNWQRIQK